jgi:ATP-dependent exoDNAse (exonuclease V) alpha subunit
LITYKPDIVGDFREIFPIEERLQLKLGAQVMFVKNIFRKNYFNGKMGVIKSLSSQEILVHFRKKTKP